MLYKQKNMNSKKNFIKIIKIVGFITLFGFMQYGCNGKLPGAAKVGGSWRVEEAALLAFMKADGEVQGVL